MFVVKFYYMSKQKRRKKLFTMKMPKYRDLWIHIGLIGLLVMGLLMVTSASMGLAEGSLKSVGIAAAKQIVFIIGGYFVMVMMANRFKLSFFQSKGYALMTVATLFALLLCLAFAGSRGAKGWIYIPLGVTTISLQPSEFTKVVSILIMAATLGDKTKRYPKTWDKVKKPFILIGVYLFIILVLQKDLGSMAVCLCICCVIFLIPRHPQLKKWQRITRTLFYGGLGFAIFFLSPAGLSLVDHLPLKAYQKGRIISAVNPFLDPYGTGFQLINGLVAFASGGFFGRGIGNSVRKYMGFPEAHTDFILPILVEELGYFGFALMMAFYTLIIVRLLVYAYKMQSEAGKMILVGTAMYFIFHMVFNIGGVTGLIPLTGVPLLIISAGGSSTLSIMMALGICQAVIHQYHKGEIQ